MISTAKITSKGQITIPLAVRDKMGLRAGDQVVFFEDNGRLCLANSLELAVKRANKVFANKTKQAGFETEEDMQNYMLKVRKKVRGY